MGHRRTRPTRANSRAGMAHYKGGRPKGSTARAFDHCALIYRTALERSTPVDALAPDVAVVVAAADLALEGVFVGSFYGLIRDLGMTSANTYYQRRSELEKMGSLRRLRHGTHWRAGVWALLREP